MKIEIQKIVRPIRLADYAPEYEGQDIHVWVNPPRQMRLDHWEIVEEFSQMVDERASITKAEAKKLGEDALESEASPEAAESLASLDQQLEDLSRRLYGWFATMWSQHNEASKHWTTDEVVGLVEACLDADARLWSWIQDEHWRLLQEHRDGVKKK